MLYTKVHYIANKKFSLYVNCFGFKCMSKQTLTSDDIYGIYKQNIEKYFESVEHTIPQYFQSLASIQEECCKSCKNAVSSGISLQQEFAKKTGISTDVPEAAKNAIIDTSTQIIKANSVQNQITQASVNAVKQNIKTWNDNASAFADLNRNILQSWISTFTQTKN